jgi:AraC-like DNA-binding protein
MRDDYAIIRSIEIIENRIYEKLTADCIASSVFVSKYHYQRLFQSIMGESVMNYVKKRKLTIAGKELAESDTTILDIALKYGYSSHEAFTRAFKAYMGVTPVDYRRYRLSAISQKILIGELNIMNNTIKYSKNTEEIIRSINAFIAEAKQTAEFTEKISTHPYESFFDVVVKETNSIVDKLTQSINNINAMVERPNEINKRFELIKIIDDIAFWVNLLTLNINIYIARAKEEHAERYKPVCERYQQLAFISAENSNKIAEIFQELAGLIFNDMKEKGLASLRQIADQIKEVYEYGFHMHKEIIGYDFIADEIENLSEDIRKSYVQLTDSFKGNFDAALSTAVNIVKVFDSYMLRINILSFSTPFELARNIQDECTKSMVTNIKKFEEKLNQAMAAFAEHLNEAENDFRLIEVKSETIERNEKNICQDIVSQCNILAFYTKGEVSKLSKLLDDNDKKGFENILYKTENVITNLHKANENAENSNKYDLKAKLAEPGSQISAISAMLKAMGEKLQVKGYGNVVLLFANEFWCLSERIAKCMSRI